MTEEQKFKNPFVEAAKKAAANPKVPGSRTAPVQNAKMHSQVLLNKPTNKKAGRGR